jgi:alpha-beta hydrolase superfamily lysophospholipase
MRGAVPLLAVLALAGCHTPVVPPATEASARTEQVVLKAADGVEVFGTYSQPAKPRGIILLFHQAESGQGEYLTIVPRLNAHGFATLTIDARAGGDMFGGNWTVKKLGKPGTYLEARQDLEAALTWASLKKLPVILWGSSYSASLVFLIAADHPGQVTALLAFSPGEYFDGKPAVGPSAAKLTLPVFVTSDPVPDEVAAAKALTDAVPSANKRLFVPVNGGVHGSSTLIAARNSGAEDVWSAVLAFLDTAVPR